MGEDILQGIENQPEPTQRALMIAAIRMVYAKMERQTTAIYTLASSIFLAIVVFLVTTKLGGKG